VNLLGKILLQSNKHLKNNLVKTCTVSQINSQQAVKNLKETRGQGPEALHKDSYNTKRFKYETGAIPVRILNIKYKNFEEQIKMLSDYINSPSLKKEFKTIIICLVLFVICGGLLFILSLPTSLAIIKDPKVNAEPVNLNVSNTTNNSVIMYEDLSESKQSVVRKAISANVNSQDGEFIDGKWNNHPEYLQLDGTVYKITITSAFSFVNTVVYGFVAFVLLVIGGLAFLILLSCIEIVIPYLIENKALHIQASILLFIFLLTLLSGYILASTFFPPIIEQKQVIEKPVDTQPTAGKVVDISNLSEQQKKDFYTAITSHSREYNKLNLETDTLVYIKSDGEFYQIKQAPTFGSINKGLSKVGISTLMSLWGFSISLFILLASKELFFTSNESEN
jgi:hypothetical protein